MNNSALHDKLSLDNERLEKEKKHLELALREMHHRLKNNLQVISSLLSLQSDYVRDEDSHKLFVNSLNRIKAMSMIHENLHIEDNYNINTNLVKLDLNNVVPSLPLDTAITFGLIVNEIISNSLKYAFPEGRSGNIKLIFLSLDNHYELVVSNDGADFPDKINIESAPSFGLLLVNTLVDQLNGTVELIRTKGTKFKINFPHNSA
jgi:two-component sensor histidine kinase